MTVRARSREVPMNSELRDIIAASGEARARNVVVLDTSKTFILASYFIIVSGRSDRHVQGIANRVMATLEKKGVRPLSVDGLETGHWVLIDFEDIVLHIFYEPVREVYDIEGLWATSPRIDIKERDKAAA